MNGKWDGMRILWIGAITLIILLILPYLGIFSIFIEPPENSNEQFKSGMSAAEYLAPETDQPDSKTIQQPERTSQDPLLELLERK